MANNSGSRFPTFEPDGTRSWDIYYQRFNFHCKSRGVNTDDGKKSELIACSSDEMFEFMQALCPQGLSDDNLTFAAICTAIENHIKPAVNEIEASALFHQRNQALGESISDYVAELRRLARPAKFGDALDRTLRDRIVVGIGSAETRALLFRTPADELTLDKTVEIARSVESSTRQAQMTTPGAVNYMGRQHGPRQQQQQAGPSQPCKHCDWDHEPHTCKYKSAICTYCSKPSHIERACRKKKRDRMQRENSAVKGQSQGQSQGQQQHKQKPKHKVHAADVTPKPEMQPPSRVPPSSEMQYFETVYQEFPMNFLHDEVPHIPAQPVTMCSLASSMTLPPPTIKKVNIDGKICEMEVDNGCPVAIINDTIFQLKWPSSTQLQQAPFLLSTWNSDTVQIKGFFMVEVIHGRKRYILPLFVGTGGGRSLLGRQWFKPLGIRVVQEEPLHSLSQPGPMMPPPRTEGFEGAAAGAGVQRRQATTAAMPNTTEQQPRTAAAATPSPAPPGPCKVLRPKPDAVAALPPNLRKYDCFKPGLGMYKGPPISLELDPTVKPVCSKFRRVAFARRKIIADEIDRNVAQGVYRGPIPYSKWATGIVPVYKDNRPPRLCGDYRCTLNKAIPKDNYPMPTVEEAFSALAGSSVYSKLDLREAYTQVPVDDATAQLLTVNTIKGLFTVHRLPFGIANAPTLFQRLLETLLAGIEGLMIWLDDILVSGPDKATHDSRLNEVLGRLSDAGLRLHPGKCTFHQSEIEYLGFKVNAEGRSPLPSKVEAIRNAADPKDVSEVRSFVGKLGFYEHFLCNRARALEPLYKLIRDGAEWVWGEAEKKAYQDAKDLLCSAELLVHYDLEKELVVSCDASPRGLGAVLSHVFPGNVERPIEYASRTLIPAEKNYSQIDREALAIVFAVKKWHNYLAGRHFVIYTDNKPLLGLFGTNKPIPQVVSPRVERWMVLMGCYSYELRYRPAKQHGNADALSRLLVPGSEAQDVQEPEGLFLMTGMPSPHLTAAEIAEETSKDPTLQQVYAWLQKGWPTRNPGNEFSPYFRQQAGLSIVRGCILWGRRVIVPTVLRQRALRHLHAAHMGINRTKALARVLLWWPGLSTEIEKMVSTCKACQATRASAPRLPAVPWPSPCAPWSRLHVDFAGPFKGKHFMVIVDAYSGWTDVYQVRGPTTEEAIKCLNTCFRFNGLPYTLVSDNGTAFCSHRFRQFCMQRGVKQLFTAPRHPSSNGMAERFVRTMKEMLERITEGDFQRKLDIALESQRSTPGEDGRTPAERLMGRPVRTALSLVIPAPVSPQVKPVHDFAVGDPVWYQRFGDPHWRPATVYSLDGAWMMTVSEEGDPTLLRRHLDQLRRRAPHDVTAKLPVKVLPDITWTKAQKSGTLPQVEPHAAQGTAEHAGLPNSPAGSTGPEGQTHQQQRVPSPNSNTNHQRRKRKGQGDSGPNCKRSTRNPNPKYKT